MNGTCPVPDCAAPPATAATVCRRLSIVAAAALALALFAPSSAHALDASKAALAMAKNGQVAYEAGQHERAMEYFLQAWQADPTRPAYVFSAARAAHVAKKLDRAEQYYREYLAASDKDNRYVDRAKAYLEDLAVQRVDLKISAAEDAEKAKQYLVAAKLYGDALQMAPQRLHLMIAQGRALFRGKAMDDAEKVFREYLAKAPPELDERKDAEANLAEIAEARRKPPPLPVVEPFPVNKVAGWSAAGLGVAAGVTGAVLFAIGKSKEAELKDGTSKVNANVQYYAITYTQAKGLADSASSMQTVGAALGLGGAAIAGFGAYWALTHGEAPPVQAAVTAEGWRVVAQLRF